MSATAPQGWTSAGPADQPTRDRFRTELVSRRARAEAAGDSTQVAKLDRMLDRLDAGQPLYTAGLPWVAPDPDAMVQDQQAQVEQVRAAASEQLPVGWTEGAGYVERRRRHSAS
jgi:hypothetical protein